MQVGAIRVPLTMGSMFNGPNIVGATAGQRGFFPGSPDGTINGSWETTSLAPATASVANQFGGQLLTRTTGGTPLLLPLQLNGNSPRELIKRPMPGDPQELSDSRYHNRAQIRILIDDENPATADAAGIRPARPGIVHVRSHSATQCRRGAKTMRLNADGTYLDTAATCCCRAGSAPVKLTVRGVKGTTQAVNLNGTATKIPPVPFIRSDSDPDRRSNGINRCHARNSQYGCDRRRTKCHRYPPRPLWAAFTQGIAMAAISEYRARRNCLRQLSL